ncbi:MAG: DUF4876 domain-containing protein, partial [Gemmatimonadota bacterium]
APAGAVMARCVFRCRGVLVAGSALAIAACEPGLVEAVHRGEGGVQRTGLHVRAIVDPADSALGDSLGWASGIPGVQVHVLRNGTAEWIVGETDSTGTVVFEGLLAGRYRVWGERVLDADEAQAVGGVVRAFGDGRTLNVGSGTNLDLLLYADRPGSLVVSELGIGTPPSWEVGGNGYFGGTFLEVYNNSDSTIFLDGIIVGHTYRWAYRDNPESNATSCINTERIRTDPDGLYADNMMAFPGTGADYPIGPGETRVIAMSAVDHTPVHPTLLDLSDADFEIGSGGVGDNPAVPNMIDVGTKSYVLVVIPSFFGSRITFLSRPLDVSAFSIVYRDHNGGGYVYIPKDVLLDVVAVRSIWPDMDVQYPPCIPSLHPDFDRYEGPFFEIGLGTDPLADAILGVYRKALRAESGRVVLYNTHTSAVDLYYGERTPGSLPPVP